MAPLACRSLRPAAHADRSRWPAAQAAFRKSVGLQESVELSVGVPALDSQAYPAYLTARERDSLATHAYLAQLREGVSDQV